MESKSKQRLADLQGVLLKLIETSDNTDELEFLHDLLEKIKNKIEGDKK